MAWPESFVFLVTDYERKFVLGVATPQDLEVNFFSSELIRSLTDFYAVICLATRHIDPTHHAILIM